MTLSCGAREDLFAVTPVTAYQRALTPERLEDYMARLRTINQNYKRKV